MKHLITTLSFILLIYSPFNSTAQEAAQEKEKHLGIMTSNLQNFSLSTRKGTNNKYVRYRLFTGSAYSDFTTNLSDSVNYQEDRLSGNLGLGVLLEKHREFDDRLSMYTGPEFTIQGLFQYRNQPTRYSTTNGVVTSIRETEKLTSVGIRPGFNWVAGLIYNINDQLYLTGDVSPGVIYTLNFTHSVLKNFDPSLNRPDVVNRTISHSPSLNVTWGVQFGIFYVLGAKKG